MSNPAGVRYFTARMDASRRNPLLSDRVRAGQAAGVSPRYLSDIESGHARPGPDKVAGMAEAYKDPALLSFYCAEQCPVGRGRMTAVDPSKPVANTALGLVANGAQFLAATVELSRILEDSHIDDGEKEQAREAVRYFCLTVGPKCEELKIWAEKHHPELLREVHHEGNP